MEIVRHPSPFGNLNSVSLLKQCGCNSVSHSYSFFFSVSYSSSSVPIPGENIIVKFMYKVKSCDDTGPHTERTVTINGVLLEISIHFIGVFIMRNMYCKSRIRDLSLLWDKYRASWQHQDVRRTICKEHVVSNNRICWCKLFFGF